MGRVAGGARLELNPRRPFATGVADATRAGIDVRLVSATMQLNQLMATLDLPSPEIARRINDEGAELMHRFPGRTVAMVSVCPFEPDHLAELDRA